MSIRYDVVQSCCELCFVDRGCSRSGCCERMVLWWGGSGIRGLAWAWRCACVQGVENRRKGSAAALGQPDRSAMCGQWSECFRWMWYVCEDVSAGTWTRKGGCKRCCCVGADLLPRHKLVSGWWGSQWQGCCGVCRCLNCAGRTSCRCACLSTQDTLGGAGLPETPTARSTGFNVDVGYQDC